MIKVLSFIIVGLLLSGLAHAASTSANLTIQIVPTGTTTPAPAVAAGFTTLAIDYDFTQSNPWSNPNNWLRCHNGSGATNPLLYQDWVGFGSWQMPTCSNISQGTDPLGSLALHVHVDQSDVQCAPPCTNIMPDIPLETVDSAGNGNQLPTNLYAEVTALSISADPSMASNQVDFWSFFNDSSVEFDGIEWFGSTTGAETYHNNASGNVFSTNMHDVMDQSAYHKYAWRVTSNGVNDGWMCGYKDDAPSGSAPNNCQNWNPTSGQASNPTAGTVQLLAGFVGCGESGLPACSNGSIDLWVRRLRVWSCAGINSGAKCFSSTANP